MIVGVRKIVLICSSVLFSCFAFSQAVKNKQFANPLAIPPLLSANFGELRPNHFHAGLDYKTEGVEGKPVFAIDSGYVSRIMIRPVGYGNALYITHSSGYVSVYAHLQSFSPEITSYITHYQLQNKMHSVDVAIEPHVLLVQRGQEIAKSGNSGSSGGPHVHFEIRNKNGDVAYNPFLFYPTILDKTQPRITSLFVYPLDSLSFVNGFEKKQQFSVRQISPGVYKIPEKIRVKGSIGMGIRANDYMHNVHNIFGVYSVELRCNNELLYARKIDSVSFYETNDINSLLDYEAFILNKQYIEKLYVEPNNSLSFYSEKNNGLYIKSQDKLKECVVTLADFHGNVSTLDFSLVYDTDSLLSVNKERATITNSYQQAFSCEKDGFLFQADSLSFYKDFSFHCTVDSSFYKHEFSLRYSVKSSELCMKKNARISIQTSIPDSLHTKALVRVKVPNGGVFMIQPVITSDGMAHFETKRIGEYSVIIDTVAPYISKPNFSNGDNLSNARSIQYTISDKLSGIDSYYAYIDNQWCILLYDAKNARITLDFSKVPLQFQNTLHTLTLVVVDMCGNETKKQYSFYK
ncbi:MAG: M23 family metallopeptidase [Bacteroidales bacterium]|nr:M23 family metallopeptidase [Bacteroidales bacterium]